MKFCLALILALAVAPRTLASRVTPVQKVIELMEGMLKMGKEEKQKEAVEYAAFVQFCTDTQTETERHIAEAEARIETLKADIEEYKANAERLAEDIAIHEGDITAWEGDMKAATTVRKLEKAAYDELHKDYSESISALERAIKVLQEQAHDRPQVSLTQLQSQKLIPDSAKKAIAVFLQQDPAEAPDAMGYEFHAHGIIEMLEKLLDKFTGERTEIEKAEKNSLLEFDLLIKDLTAQVANAKEAMEEKKVARAKNLQDAADAQGEVDELTAIRDEDKKYLANLVATCEQKAEAFKARQTLRADEIVAIQKAIEIISDNAVKGSEEKYLTTSQRGDAEVAAAAADAAATATSLAALRSESQSVQQKRVANYLRRQADKTGSRVLALLATRVESDPFAKVKKMIKDLIIRLQEEAAEEADHKAWCDEELSVNEQTRKEKTAQVEILHANVDELETSIARITEELAKLAQAIQELTKAMEEATELRAKEKARNKQTVEDAVQAQEAVAQALTVLKEFYAKAAEATAFVQKDPRNPEIPEMYKNPYKGMGGEAGGVVGMLEVIESDFARLEAETTAAEEEAQKEYDTFMAESKADKEAKEKEVENKNFKKQDEEQSLVVNKKNLAGTQKELDASLEYFDKLKPSCIEVGMSYDERVARRKEEIESLQDALKILDGQEIA